MKTSDVKRLWGKSGNRCAIGRIELSSDDTGIIGDTCHIVAKSPDGPRGGSPLSKEERDKYDNLILLCPTHHRIIDSDDKSWPVERLKAKKREHEEWVSESLDKRAFHVESFNNQDFLSNRMADWVNKSAPYPAIAISLTPYRVSDDTIVANDRETLSLVNSASIGFGYTAGRFNSNYTKPSPNGMRNETFARASDRKYSIEVCRSGHCESVLSFEETLRGMEGINKKYEKQTGFAKYVIQYDHLANGVASSIDWLIKIWNSKLPFHEMTFKATLLNAKDTNMFAQHYEYSDSVFGTKMDVDDVSIELVLYRDFDVDDLLMSILTRFSNSYGLWLHTLRTEKNEWKRPDRNIL